MQFVLTLLHTIFTEETLELKYMVDTYYALPILKLL